MTGCEVIKVNEGQLNGSEVIKVNEKSAKRKGGCHR